MFKNEIHSEIENRIEISLIIDDNNSTLIEIDLEKATDFNLGNICATICKKYELSKKIHNKLMNQIKKEINDIKSKNKKEAEVGMVKRLYYESISKSKEKQAIIEKAKKQKEEQLACEFKFTPKINKSSNKIYERDYLKIEDKLYYDYKKSQHKKGFHKFIEKLQSVANNSEPNEKSIGKLRLNLKSTNDKEMDLKDEEAKNHNNQNGLINENAQNTAFDKSVEEDMEINFKPKRKDIKKLTFHSSSKKLNFLTMKEGKDSSNNFQSNTNMNANVGLNIVPNSSTNTVLHTKMNSTNSLKQESSNNIINHLRKTTNFGDKMEHTATFTNNFLNNNNTVDNNNQNPNNILTPGTQTMSTNNIENANNSNNLKAYKSQKAFIADNVSNTLGNNFLNTFSQLINSQNVSPKLEHMKPSTTTNSNNGEHELYLRKNNFGKQFTFSTNNLTANIISDRKISNQSTGNTYTEKYEKLIGKSSNTNKDNISTNPKTPSLAECLNENNKNNFPNQMKEFKESKEKNINNNLYVPDRIGVKKNLIQNQDDVSDPYKFKDLNSNICLDKNSKINNLDTMSKNNLNHDEFFVSQENPTSTLNKSNTTSDIKIRSNNQKKKKKNISDLTERNKGKMLRKANEKKTNKKSSDSPGKKSEIQRNSSNNLDRQNHHNSKNKSSVGKESGYKPFTCRTQNKQSYSTWYDRLHKTKEDYKSVKEAMIEKQINKVCPFTPKISDQSRVIASKSRSKENQQQFLDRLTNAKRINQIFKDSKLIRNGQGVNKGANNGGNLVLIDRHFQTEYTTNSLSRSKSLNSRRKKNYDGAISPIYGTQSSKDILSHRLDVNSSKRNYASTYQSENVDSDFNSFGKLILNTENNKYDNTNSKSRILLSSGENSNLNFDKNLRNSKRLRILKEEKHLVEISNKYFEDKQNANKIIQEKCHQSISKFKHSNMKELFEKIVTGYDLNLLPNHIKEKLLIPVCNNMNERNLEFNFQNFYMVADEILKNFFK